MVLEFDPTRHFLGNLCKRGHDWDGTGKSLRYGEITGSCAECSSEQASLRYERHKEEIKARSRANHHKRKAENPSEAYKLKQWCIENGFIRLQPIADQYDIYASQWLDREETKRIIADAEKVYGTPVIVPIRSKSGTWAHPAIAEEFKKWLEPVLVEIEFNSDIHVLGNICRRNHDYKGTGQTLRYAKNGVCVACSVNSRKKYSSSETGKAKKKAYGKVYQQLPSRKIYEAAYRKSEKRKQAVHRYNTSEKGRKLRQNRDRLRYTLEKNAHAIGITREGLDAHLKRFGDGCAYCGSTSQRIEVDHFIPVTKGGSNCLSNLVPACRHCNNVKTNHDPYEWYKRQSFFKQKQWRLILKILGKTEANYNQIPLL